MARIRITIEYDPDLPEGKEITPELLARERQAWIDADVAMHDVVVCEGESAVKFEVIADIADK
jgi:hypothetical protein